MLLRTDVAPQGASGRAEPVRGAHLAAWLVAATLNGCALRPVPAPPAAPPPEPTPVLPAPAPAPPPAPLPPPPPPPPDPAALADAAARRLLAFNERLRELGPADLAREAGRLAEPGDSAASLELALVLSQTRQPGDLTRALGLVEPLTRNGAPPTWQPLARLLQTRLTEQRRLEEQTERQAQQLREQQRRLEQLNNQLEALKAIERSLTARPPLPVSPNSPASAPAGAPNAR